MIDKQFTHWLEDQVCQHGGMSNDGCAAACIKDLLLDQDAEIEKLRNWLIEMDPWMDAMICYASTRSEHRPNGIAKEIRAYLSPDNSTPKKECYYKINGCAHPQFCKGGCVALKPSGLDTQKEGE